MPRVTAKDKPPAGYYNAYMRQSEVWPSYSKQETVRIADMAPAHAINAYHVLRDQFFENWPTDRLEPLPMALLSRAVGIDIYPEDVKQKLSHTQPKTVQQLRKVAYDALMHLANEDSNLHVIDKTEVLTSYLVDALGGLVQPG